MSEVEIQLPPKLIPVFTPPRGSLRYRGAYGGRGSGKSFTFARMAAVFGYAEPLRILCVREFQNSIKESFHAEIKNAIASIPWLENHYDVGVDYIRGANGTEFIFKGLRNNTQSVKSLAQIDLCIVEEAEDIQDSVWQILEPTIRAPKSEIWVVWNSKQKGSATDNRFIQSIPPRSNIVQMNYIDNPWFPDELEEQRLHAQRVMDPATYAHVWDGAYLERSEAQIFRNKYVVEEFEPHHKLWDGPYFGLDFGFSNDPSAAVEAWIADNRLYVRRDCGKVGLELDDTTDYLKDNMPGIELHTIRGDNARPESISYLKRKGLPRIVACQKGKGSVEDGVEFIKSFEKVVIHPEAKNVLNEFNLYSYKVDRLSGDILPLIEDKNNHWIDGLRYALEPIMKKGRMIDYSKLL